ncbi:MAG: hypothetical protein ACPGU7_13205 [Gammaproteobacteria bacterium]
MSLTQYKDAGLLFNTNFMSETSTPGLFGFRGELVLIQGEIADDKGHHKPPVDLMLGAVMLADEKIKLLIGQLEDIASLPNLVEKYSSDFAEDMIALIYVVNLSSEFQVEIGGITFVLIPLVQGVPWNEVIDELGLEKSDFKGQSAADKIVTLYDEMKSYKPRYPAGTLEDVLAAVTEAKREGWGAV